MEYITEYECEVINHARRVCAGVASRAGNGTAVVDGRIITQADATENSLFMLLNLTYAYGGSAAAKEALDNFRR